MYTDLVYLAGIDPGGNTGISVIGLHPITLDIETINTYVFVLDSYVKDESSRMLDKWITIEKIIQWLMVTYEPKIIGMESAFLNQKYPKAIINLSSYTTMIEFMVNKYGTYTKLFKYPPKYIKKLTCKGDANKSDMLQGISSIEEIRSKLNLNGLTEHEIDATAICYVVVDEVRHYPYILFSI